MPVPGQLEQSEIARRVQERLGARLLQANSFQGQHQVVIRPDALVELICWLRDEPSLSMDMLIDVGGVDLLQHPQKPSWRFEVVYQVMSLSKKHRFRVKVAVEDDSVEVPSLWELWGLANWMEREVYDMFGVRFSGHPNLRRILCHDEFEGHALRKDYPITRRQRLSAPTEYILTDKVEWA